MSAGPAPNADLEPLVYVVDDDPGVLDSVCLLLRSEGIPSVGCPSASAFLEVHDPAVPGCLVLDLRMPGMSGMDLQKRLLEMGIRIPIIFVTAHGEVSTAVEAVKAGAVDFIEKPFSDEKLLGKIRESLELDLRNRARRAARREIQERVQSLTPREREVMALVVAGRLNKKIARELEISQRTVEVHRARVMEKMKAGSVSELVQIVLEAGEDT